MDGLSAAASIIAVVDLSAKVASLCFQYSREVKNAKPEISRLQGEVKNLKDVVAELQQLLDGPESARLSASQELFSALKDCALQLDAIKAKLNPSIKRETMSRFGLRALKWPFESKEVDRFINRFEKCRQTFSLALQVDQTTLLLDIGQKIDLAKLPCAEGAAFDSYDDELDARCLPGTRLDLLQQIRQWSETSDGECIFWLSGMAGTGKSTISRTVAQTFSDCGRLGASFFFKRGESDRGHAARFFTTIITGLMLKVPALRPSIRKVIEVDPLISSKSLKEQFKKLILQPLSEMKHTHTLKLVVVVDALDECEREGDINIILGLLPQVQDLGTISLRIFMTSRPELPIRLGFKNMSRGTHQDFALHEIPRPVIEQDISIFLKHELAKIKSEHNHFHRQDVLALSEWPSERNLQALVEMATPLFIFAATMCRFVGEQRFNPEKRLTTLLEQRTRHTSQIDATYLPVMNQLLVGVSNSEKDILIREFQIVIGSIIMLADPLSTGCLANLICISKEDIYIRLDLLHSVLSIPTNQDSPVRLLHLSFRDFLLGLPKHGTTPFWIDERATHEMIAIKCIELMSRPHCLRENMCNLESPGKLRVEIDNQILHKCLPTDLRYACRYWVYHLEHGEWLISDQDRVHIFLQRCLLYWLEALSLMGDLSQSFAMIDSLVKLLSPATSSQIFDFLHDARHFIGRTRYIADISPLQIYSSGLVFAPESSIVKKTFRHLIPRWIQQPVVVDSTWTRVVQNIETSPRQAHSVAFSPDGKLIASSSSNKTVRIWEAVTGVVVVPPLEGHSGAVQSVAFSPDGKLIASGSRDMTIRVWDVVTGVLIKGPLEGHSDCIYSVTFSPDGRLIASGSGDATVKIWDLTTTETTTRTLKGHSNSVTSVAFSPDGRRIASGSEDTSVKIWNTTTGAVQTLEGHSKPVDSVAFSPDGNLIASGSMDGTVKLWDVPTGVVVRTFQSSDFIPSIAFSPNGKLIASGSGIGTVRIWDVSTGAVVQKSEGDFGLVTSVGFSLDIMLVALASFRDGVKICETATKEDVAQKHEGAVSSVAISPDGKGVVSGSNLGTIQIWDAITGAVVQTRTNAHSGWVMSLTISPDGKLVAWDSTDQTIRFWNTATGAIQRLAKPPGWVGPVAIYLDRLVASGADDGTIQILDVVTGSVSKTLKVDFTTLCSLTFSPDGKLVASGSYGGTVRIWNTGTGAVLTLKDHLDVVVSVAFSLDGKLVVSQSLDRKVWIWDALTGDVVQTFNSPSDWTRSGGFFMDGQYPALCVAGDWVTKGTEPVLWLPQEYRPCCIAVRDNLLVLGRRSGTLLFIQSN